MKCPKDADYKKNEQVPDGCQSKFSQGDNIYRYCTRNLNHKGKHHHHDQFKACIQTWTDEELCVEAL